MTYLLRSAGAELSRHDDVTEGAAELRKQALGGIECELVRERDGAVLAVATPVYDDLRKRWAEAEKHNRGIVSLVPPAPTTKASRSRCVCGAKAWDRTTCGDLVCRACGVLAWQNHNGISTRIDPYRCLVCKAPATQRRARGYGSDFFCSGCGAERLEAATA